MRHFVGLGDVLTNLEACSWDESAHAMAGLRRLGSTVLGLLHLSYPFSNPTALSYPAVDTTIGNELMTAPRTMLNVVWRVASSSR